MLKKICLGIVVFLVIFIGYVSTRPSQFDYESSGIIHASSDKIFPYISHLKMGSLWSPYEKRDPKQKKKFIGIDVGFN
jgi:Na+/proline symporter